MWQRAKNCDRTPMPVLRHWRRTGMGVLSQFALKLCTEERMQSILLRNPWVVAQCKSRPTWRRTEPVFMLPACRFVGLLVSMQKELAVFCGPKRYLAVFCEPNCDRTPMPVLRHCDRTPMPVLRHFALKCKVAQNRQLTYYLRQTQPWGLFCSRNSKRSCM